MSFKIICRTTQISLFILFLVTVIESCSKLPIAKSYWEKSNNISALVYSGYQKKTNIRWTIGNNKKFLYLDIETANRSVTRTIMMRGFTIYFDTTGKKKESVYFKYPYRGGFNETFMNFNRRNFNQRQRSNRSQQRKFKSPTRAYWKNGKSGMVINTAREHSDFKYSMKLDTLGYLTYKVDIPLNEIESHGYQNVKELSVGILTSARQNNQFHQQFSDRGGFGGRGGFRGGRGGFGGGSGRSGHRRFSGIRNHNVFSTTDVKIWFLTRLSRKSV